MASLGPRAKLQNGIRAAFRRRRSAFTLLESLIALAILGVAILFFVMWIWQVWEAEKRLEAHRVALRELEAQNEALRSGGYPPSPGEMAILTPLTDLSRLGSHQVEAEAVALETPGLYSVTLRVRYQLGTQAFDHSLEALTWQP